MAKKNFIGFIIATVIALILLGVLLPIALNDLLGFTSTVSTVQTLVATVLPILAVITVVILFIPRDSSQD